MPFITTQDGTEIFYKDWGDPAARPIVFHHGWPLSADDWDNQMMFFLAHGFRVIAHDRRGHGRSTQTWTGNDMDTYAADVIALAAALDLKGAVHVGHSTGGGEVARYVARAEPGRVAKAALISAVRHKVSPEARVAWSGTRWFHYVRNRLLIERKWAAPWPALAVRSAAYLAKGARNGMPLETARAVAAAWRAPAEAPRRMSERGIAYLARCDGAHRGGVAGRLRREVFSALPG